MTLQNAVHYFTVDAGSLSCLSIACGDTSHVYTAMGGVKDEEGTTVERDSIFDLASLTKLFNVLAVFRMVEQGKIQLSDCVATYAPQFKNLRGITVEQILGFEVALTTPQRIDAQACFQDALQQLYAVEAGPNGVRAYSDIHAMVLKCILEGAADASWWDVIQREICIPLNMHTTFVAVPKELYYRCVSTNNEHRFIKGAYIHRYNGRQGMPHDPKAVILQGNTENCFGHAGLFSTIDDMVKLCHGILQGDVISRASLQRMAVNHTGKVLPDGRYTQFLGCQCYVKHPVQYYSEVPSYMTQSAIALSGFTGHHISLDFEKGIFALYLGNRVMNRLSTLIPEAGKSITDYGLQKDGIGWFTWPDGQRIRSSVDYVHLKDAHFHRAVADTLQV